MYVRLAQRPEIAPSDWVKHVRVQSLVIFQDHSFVTLEDFEKEDDIWITDVRGILVDNEFFTPVARVLPSAVRLFPLFLHLDIVSSWP